MTSSKKHINLDKLNLKNGGFEVPKYYFETVEPKVMAQLKNDIPSNYFDSVEDNILDKLNINTKKSIKVISLKNKWFTKVIPLIAAASLILFIGLNFFTKQTTVNFNTLDSTTISNWVASTDDSDAYILGEYLETNDINSLTSTSEFDDSDLENYLNQTNLEDLLINN